MFAELLILTLEYLPQQLLLFSSAGMLEKLSKFPALSKTARQSAVIRVMLDTLAFVRVTCAHFAVLETTPLKFVRIQ